MLKKPLPTKPPSANSNIPLMVSFRAAISSNSLRSFSFAWVYRENYLLWFYSVSKWFVEKVDVYLRQMEILPRTNKLLSLLLLGSFQMDQERLNKARLGAPFISFLIRSSFFWKMRNILWMNMSVSFCYHFFYSSV